MGRAPCCDKANVKKGPWSPEEDAKLKSYIEQHGTGGNWIALPQKIGLKRCGKSCRLRWLNYLRPNIKHGGFSEEEDNIICSLYITIGSRWSIIAAQLPGRTDNDIKNYWNTKLKSKLLGKQRKEKRARQETVKENDNPSFPEAINYNQTINPYLPQLPLVPPIPYSKGESSFCDHNSIRKLLIKLGGRFSGDDHHLVSANPTAEITNATAASPPLVEANEYNMNEVYTPHLFQEQRDHLPSELERVVYNNTENLHGLEFLYSDMMNAGTSNATSTESINDWVEMNSLVFMVNDSLSYDGARICDGEVGNR